jgi:hypothetical protein
MEQQRHAVGTENREHNAIYPTQADNDGYTRHLNSEE